MPPDTRVSDAPRAEIGCGHAEALLPHRRSAHAYLVAHGTPPDDVQRALIEETAKLGGDREHADRAGAGRVPHDADAARSVRRTRSRSARSPATRRCASRAACRHDGHLLCCDVSEEWTSIARKYWSKAGVDDRIELRIAPAVETLEALPNDESIDFAFIDADKPNYRNYYEALLPRMRAQRRDRRRQRALGRRGDRPGGERREHARRSRSSTTSSPPTTASTS